ncbi:MAG: TolC family protein [Candidatus Melainabacteria bacterium]|nr:MAG: TolC family protein [Candidatus Melainabacteria bacterium]
MAILSQVGTCYFNIVKLDKLISLQNEIINKRKNIYDLMKMKHNEGLSSTSDLVNAEKAYINSTVDLIDLKKSTRTCFEFFCCPNW